MITVSAPGKIHLMGEHAVVYGKPALLAAVNLRLSVSIQDATRGFTIIAPEGESYIRHAMEVTAKALNIKTIPPLTLTLTSQIPIGYHLGSSAATAVATVGAMMYFTKKLWNPERINQIAYEVEKKQHGNPSGGDNTTVTFGGFIWFRKELEFLKSIWQFPFSFPEKFHHFFLINTGRPKETTGEMVELVQKQEKEDRKTFQEIFLENEKQTKRLAAAIKAGNEEELMDAIRKGEKTLEEMGVVSSAAASLLRDIERIGGVGKILGGGGKNGPVGCLLCYHHKPHEVETLCKPYGYSIHHIVLGEEGVRLERKN